MDETMRELNTDDLEQILDESRADESENQLQELMPEKEALFRQQAEEEAARIQAEEPAPVTEAEVKPEETVQEESAPGEVPAEAELTEEERDAILSQDTIRLDDLQEVIAMTNTRDFVPLGDDDGVTDETIRLDDIAQAAILEEEGFTYVYSENGVYLFEGHGLSVGVMLDNRVVAVDIAYL